jgi:hypothetical protein
MTRQDSLYVSIGFSLECSVFTLQMVVAAFTPQMVLVEVIKLTSLISH